MKLNNIKDITDFIFVGKEFEELSHYDLLIINSDWAEEQLAKDMKKMLEKNIIDDNTTFLICGSHNNPDGSKSDRDTAKLLIGYLNELGFKNRIIVDNEYIENPKLLKNIDKLVDINKYDRVLRIAKDFVARRWYMNAKRHNFPIEKCDFYGVVDSRCISKNDWYKSEIGVNQVMKEFINIGKLTIDRKLSID